MPARASRSVVYRLIRAVLIVVGLILLAPYALTPLYHVANPVSTLMLWRKATGARVERTWVPLTAIAPALPRTVMASEDARYCTHHGIDFGELRNAIEDADDLSEMRGGSTITQQTAKNLFLWQGRSVVRKALEFPLALWLDLCSASGASWKSISTLPSGARTASSARRRAPGMPSANRPGTSPAVRLRCSLPCCQIRSAAVRPGRARACGASRESMRPGPPDRARPSACGADRPPGSGLALPGSILYKRAFQIGF
jgi:hypothetical protein